jgi:hypothetical protein
VQGQLRGEHLSCTVETACGHCQAPIQIEIDSELACQAAGDAQPLVYVPMVDVQKLEAPSIIDGF